MGKAGTYKARYAKNNVNPFKSHRLNQKNMDVKVITVQLDEDQAENKDELAKDATPKGYNFIECEMV